MRKTKLYETILFRADANSFVGFGHIMRCLSIADAAASLNHKVIFILADGTAKTFVEQRGYQAFVLGTGYDRLEEETEKISSVIAEKDAGTLVVDSYYVTERYLSTLLEICKCMNCRLVYIDDVLAFPYSCDMLLNYNIYGTDADYKRLYAMVENTPVLLTGTSFVPLRREFLNVKSCSVCMQGKNILITTGGSDPEHLTVKIIGEIGNNMADSFVFHIIIGIMNEDKDIIRSQASKLQNVVLHENVKNMSTLMLSADVAVSAAGSTLYELCATQTPTITYILADNQIPGAEGFERRGILKNCGDIRSLGGEELARRLVKEAVCLCGNYDERCQIAEKMSRVVDGRGAERIVRSILQM